MTALNNSYALNNVVRASVAFTVSAVATDPTTITLSVKDPSGTVSTYTYANSDITKDTTGNYHKDITCSTAGTWHYSYRGTGTCAAQAEGFWFIIPTEAA